MNGVNTSQDRRLGAFHDQPTLADGTWTAGPAAHAPAAHAPTVVDVPLAAPPPVAPRQGPTRAG